MLMDLTFHIIFVPGTQRYLRLAVLSLLKHSPYRYRLVANGLDDEELRSLGAFCETSERLEFCPFPTGSVLPHGHLLSLLQGRESASHFCFLDSDIFAAASFADELEEHLTDCDIFSSCDLMWMDSNRIATGGSGSCRQTTNGIPLATSFFAVYRNKPLRQLIQDHRVGFEVYDRPEHFSRPLQYRLRELGLSTTSGLDTGKLLSVLAHDDGLRQKYHSLESLIHIGSITRGLTRQGWGRERLTKMFRRPFVLRDDDLKIPLLDRRRLRRSHSTSGDEGLQERVRHANRWRRRRVSLFFALFLQSLMDGTPEPILGLEPSDLRQRIAAACDLIRTLRLECPAAAA